MKKGIILLLIAAGMQLFAEETINMGEISVTAGRMENNVRSTPKSVAVLTSDEIEKSGVSNLAEALKLIPEVEVKDYNGTGRMTTLDIRGQGETSANNVLMLIDGIPHSPIDMSGNDLNSVSVEDIERIEILPGTGGVLYGDRAVGGVINIITKRDKKKGISGMVKAEAGSFGENKISGNILINSKRFYIGAEMSKNKIDGYRDHSKADGRFLNLNYGLKLNDENRVEIKYSDRNDSYNMPGSLYIDEMDKNRKQALYSHYNLDWTISRLPEEEAKADIKEKNYEIIYKFDGKTNSVENAMNYSIKQNDSLWSGGFKSKVKNNSIRDNLKVSQKIGFNYLTAGIDYQNGKSNADGEIITKENIGMFWYDKMSFFNDLLGINIGQRKEEVKFNFYNSQETEFSKFLKEYGINVKYSNFGNLFFNYGEGYRVPATDEFFIYPAPDYAKKVNKSLIPQFNKNYEIGIKDGNDYFVVKATAFINNTKDEIFLNPVYMENQNIPGTTERRGAEISSEQYIGDDIIINEYVNIIDSEIKDGIFKNKRIPGVADKKAGAGITWKYAEEGKAGIKVVYSGKKYAISDFKNELEKKGDYTRIDFNISHKLFGAEIFANVDNVLNTKYYEYFVKGSKGIGYYPSPERNVKAGIKYQF